MRRNNAAENESFLPSEGFPTQPSILRGIGWEIFLLTASLTLGGVLVTTWHSIHTSSAPRPHDVLVLTITALGILLTGWNLLNAAIAHLGSMRRAPTWVKSACTVFVSRWGTTYAHRILLRSGAQLALGVSAFTLGVNPLAFAVGLPSPDLPSADTSMSASETLSPPMSSTLPEEATQSAQDTTLPQLPSPTLSDVSTPRTI